MHIDPSRASCTTALLCAALLSGCAVVNPYVRARDTHVLANPTLDNAVRYAVKTREAYYNGIRDHTLFNRSAGVALIGTAAAAAALGIQGGNSTMITELGIAGAGLFGVSRILYSERRLRVYAAGAQAITCTLVAFAPLRAASDDDLRVGSEALADRITLLRAKLDGVRLLASGVQANTRVVFARSVLDASEATLTRAHQAIGALRGAGVRLYDAVEETRGAVNKALIQDEPDLAEIVAGANSLIRANAKLLTEEPAEPSGEGGVSGRAPKYEAYLDELERIARETEAVRLRVEALLANVGTAPTVEQLKACAVDPDAAGFTFRTEPRGTVTLDMAGDGIATVQIRGGKPPYYATWEEATDPPGLTLSAVKHTEGAPHGTFTIEATSQATAGRQYRLGVRDSGSGGHTLLVLVKGAKAGGGGGGGGGGGAGGGGGVGGGADSGTIKRVQKNLIATLCLPNPLPTGSPADDGVWGSATTVAFADMLRGTGTKPEDYYIDSGPPTEPPTAKFLEHADKDAKLAVDNFTWTVVTDASGQAKCVATAKP